MVDSKENYKFDLVVKGLSNRIPSVLYENGRDVIQKYLKLTSCLFTDLRRSSTIARHCGSL